MDSFPQEFFCKQTKNQHHRTIRCSSERTTCRNTIHYKLASEQERRRLSILRFGLRKKWYTAEKGEKSLEFLESLRQIPCAALESSHSKRYMQKTSNWKCHSAVDWDGKRFSSSSTTQLKLPFCWFCSAAASGAGGSGVATALSFETCLGRTWFLSIWLYMLATDFSMAAKFWMFLRIPLSSLRGGGSGTVAGGGTAGCLAGDLECLERRWGLRGDEEEERGATGRGGGCGGKRGGDGGGGGGGGGSSGGGGGGILGGSGMLSVTSLGWGARRLWQAGFFILKDGGVGLRVGGGEGSSG